MSKPILDQVLVVSFVAIVATVGVYGIVALIVRMDDAGFKLKKMSKNPIVQAIGNVLVQGLPIVIKSLSYIGTVALLLVAGGIFVHYIDFIHHFTEGIQIPDMAKEFITGLTIGFAVLSVVILVKKVFNKK